MSLFGKKKDEKEMVKEQSGCCYGQTKGFSYIHGNSLFLLISIDYESVAEKKC